MIPDFDKVHNKFKLNNGTYSHEDLKEVAYSFIKEGEPFERELGMFLSDWLDSKDYIKTQTSGTTGKPKTIKIKKQAMVYSAIATGNYFDLKPGDTALHCLPTQFIAGKMMLVRAFILGLEIDIIEPTTLLHFNTEKQYDFCAMIPMQLQSNLKKLNNIKKIIVGGAPLSSKLVSELQTLKTEVYATYGMTETVTHIAVKKINNFTNSHSNPIESSYYETLPNIKISQDKRTCLVIDAPELSENQIITNDMVKLHSKTSFEWLGRFDNVINSGGIKFFPEQIEEKLKAKIQNRFFIASETDEKLGEKLILIIEAENNKLPTTVFEGLDAYEIPKKIYAISKFLETDSGKIQRLQTLASI
ncbi:AMP-binding protein [Bizionia arctica]|uniref:O-succinylbenzoic acid--CoA ligase n=1 Tax=Bizionia arctica TaxID=1495645 RepID=A0A917GHD9_9FLAO|nr:AMP-binding protein [Bizionia arctica]GGG45298.1 O-succinylbenzoic acid--CoA ligase [Bizionia arctica]